MIKPEPCRGCGRMLLLHRIANLVVRLEIEPLDGQTATRGLLDGRELWRVTQAGLSPAKPDVLAALVTAEPGKRPHVVQTHRCTAAGAPASPPVAPTAQPTPPRPPVGRATRFSGPQTAPSSARSAGLRRSEPRCDGCGQPCADGTYAAIELGNLVVWAQHVEDCDG